MCQKTHGVYTDCAVDVLGYLHIWEALYLYMKVDVVALNVLMSLMLALALVLTLLVCHIKLDIEGCGWSSSFLWCAFHTWQHADPHLHDQHLFCRHPWMFFLRDRDA